MFSFVPRCQGLFGSQKKTGTPVHRVKTLCIANSVPRSQVSERNRPRGRSFTLRMSEPTTLAESFPQRGQAAGIATDARRELQRECYLGP